MFGAIRNIRKRILDLYLTERPVSAIIQISFDIKLLPEEETNLVASNDIRLQERLDRLRCRFRLDFLDRCKKGVFMATPFQKNVVYIQLDEISLGSNYFTTQSIHNDQVMIAFFKHVTRELKSTWQYQIEKSPSEYGLTDVKSVSMRYLLTKPMENYDDQWFIEVD